MNHKIHKEQVTKVSGERVPFNEAKLRQSLLLSGASETEVAEIVGLVENKLYEGMPTRLIYQYAFDSLKHLSAAGIASRYKLKKAIMELGPSGYPFEQFVGILFASQGFAVQVGTIQEGSCVSHEIDVLADNDKVRYMMECKYHNTQGTKSDVKVPLYVQSRFEDVNKKWKLLPEMQGKTIQGWIVTNTRFTDDAIKYAQCAGLQLLGWDFPHKDNLKQRIEQSGLYPLTCLTGLSNREKQWLLEQKIVLCNELMSHKKKLIDVLRISNRRLNKLQQEIDNICTISCVS